MAFHGIEDERYPDAEDDPEAEHVARKDELIYLQDRYDELFGTVMNFLEGEIEREDLVAFMRAEEERREIGR